jgi:GTP-binding protein EngB required for normal cell division
MHPAQTSDGAVPHGALEAAVAHAVSESLDAITDYQRRVDDALTALEGVAVRARAGVAGDTSANEVVEAFWKELQSTRTEAADLFDRQRKVLGTVNIALFGRTGAGKSSLIEALVHGDGATVSTSESDFTTEVRTVSWHGCRFIDTPGTNGWGRSASRDTLEGRARHAVEVADIVVLCFDTQSQQKGEFEKIGAWVKEYGKPVVAVLNVRNPLWRRPASVPLGTQRRRLSRAVREHVTNIETELAALGVFGAPVVAISAQRAVYARVSGEYRGPAPEQFAKLRKELGLDGLAKASNFEVLEALFVHALVHHVKELRFGMLHGQVRTLLERLARVLQKTSDDARTAAGILDRAIEGLLAVVGYPGVGTQARNALKSEGRREDLLSWVERARGGPYDTKAQGKLARFARQRLEAEIGALRARSLSAAEEVVARAFEERRDLGSDEFSKAVFQQGKIQAACERVAKESAEFVRRETRLVVDDARLDFEFALGAGAAVAGTTGKTRRIVGYALSAGGVLSGIVSTLMGAAFLDPEPVSKVALAAGVFVAGLGAMVLGWFGGKQRKKAEEARQRAWADAIAGARRSVNDTYDGFAKQVSNTATALALDATIRLLTDPLSRAGALWTLVTESNGALSSLGQLRAALPATDDAQGAIKDAAATVGAQKHHTEGGPTATLLGEGWISDLEGLKADEGSAEPVRTRAYDPGVFQRMFEGLRSFVDRFGESVERGSGSRWLRDTEQLLAADPTASQALAELNAIANRGRARLQLFGDYSAGKTSFVKRLLIDGGLPVPESVEVRADPTTDRVHVYEWEQVDLIDTPGLQSMKDSHGQVAMAAYPDASAIIYLLQPNLLVGDTQGVERVLKGDRSAGLVPKLDRTIFVIHRADELGADPETVPDEYVRLCERKKTELQQALLSRGIPISADRVFCMSADPYQLVGDRRDISSDQFDRFRSWDGFAEFRKSIREINARYAGTGVDRSILEGGLARLGALDESTRKRLVEIEQRTAALDRLGVVLSEIVAEGERIDGELRARARRMVDDHAFGQLERVAGAASDAELEATAKQLAEWWKHPAFEGDAERWQGEAKTAIDDWFQRSVDLLERTVNAPRFKAAVAGANGSFDPSTFTAAKQGWFGKIMSLVAQPLKGATRDVVYWVGKALGATFRPWGAVKLARLLGRVGVVLGVVATIFDAINLYRAWQGEKRRTELRQKLRGIVEETAKQVLGSLTDGNEEAAGPMTYLKAVQDHLRSAAEDLAKDRSALASEAAALSSRREVYGTRMAAAWTMLGIKEATA